jgi:hypothetical protein
MVRAVLENGSIRLLSQVPPSWSDGRDLVVIEAPCPDELWDLEGWSREIDDLVAALPPEDFDRVDAALAEADCEAKDLVRRQMELT